MKIAIIGAGVAGLSALRHCLEEGHDCVVLERNNFIGGTWKYVETTGIDEFGLPVHSSMYKHLRTNLPKELMQLDGFPYPSDINYSYLTHEEVLNYIHKYAQSFNLLPYIKLLTYVIEVNPLPRKTWSIKFKNLKTNAVAEREFDSVIVSVGNYSVPFIPRFHGLKKFSESAIHSHDYRNVTPYKNKSVVVVGAGFSGIDIAKALAATAKEVILSHRGTMKLKVELPNNVVLKPEIQKFKSHSIIFKDGVEYEADAVIFCTGYRTTFPFLSAKCGISVKNNCISSLYKHVINTEHPTMAFIGVPKHIPVFPLVGLQVKFFLAYMRGKFRATKEDMLEDIQKYKEICNDLGQPMDHDVGKNHRAYVEDLASTAKLECTKPVLNKMYDYVINEKFQIFNLSYKIINDDEFSCNECLC